ncbi:malate dehydrogenase [Bacillus sp. FJAT-27231]|uniref:malate dehydrogenase n=1 Tax=Bacillus sp. FJAT-27231 TaxID=1679168 RepID=UPI000670C36F|nr:malate dehydrogenase [Bacillus sp. FJAT-27231]KMY53786.1 malate dehydrogenase [Bacillus sp. FJAT-27231]
MAFKRKKIAIVGAGFTGTTIAFMLVQKELGDVILIDQPSEEKPVKGKSLDIYQSTSIQKVDSRITGTSNYAKMAGADLVIVTAGLPRKPGMDRDDLIEKNAKVIEQISKNIRKYAPDSYVLILSNPVDAMTYLCLKKTGFPKNRVIGQSGVLDTARFNAFIAEELNISIEDISSFVLGGHGDKMLPLIRFSYAGGIPLDRILSPERLSVIIERTRKGGGEIVELLGKGSAYYAPAAAVVQMAGSIIKDKKKILPTVAYLEGEYGYNDICLGVPCVLGGNGIESTIELALTKEEKEAFNRSADSVRSTIKFLHSSRSAWNFQ